MKVTTFSVDVAKTVFQVHGFDGRGERVLARRVRRAELLRFFRARVERCHVVMEACRSSHHWARELRGLGCAPELIAPQHVKALVVGNKTDANDADAIYEASRRPKVGRVAIKTVEQQEVQALHRVRDRLIKARTALLNQIRGILGEVGLVFGERSTALRRALPEVLEDAEAPLSMRLRGLVAELWAEAHALDTRIEWVERQLAQEFKQSEQAQRLDAIEGVGPLIATAVLATVGTGRQFTSGRQFAAWLGLVPKERSSGERRQLGHITKRGDCYLRKLLVHGARAATLAALRKDDPRSRWVKALVARRGHNRAVVAVANKTARIIWALLVSGERYRPAIGA